VISVLLIKLKILHIWLRSKGLTTYEYLQKTRYTNKIEPIQRSNINLAQSRESSHVIPENASFPLDRQFTAKEDAFRSEKSNCSKKKVPKLESIILEEGKSVLSSIKEMKMQDEEGTPIPAKKDDFYLKEKN